MAVAPRAVVVWRRTEYAELIDRHGTRRQAEFFVDQRGGDLAELDRRHEAQAAALAVVQGAIPAQWRRTSVERADLSRWLFEPDDVIVVVGQDGLVANVAKYLDGQVVVGVDPDPGRNAGVLVTIAPVMAAKVLAALDRGGVRCEERALVEVRLDDGRSLVALNEVFIGDAAHQSARYRLTLPDGRHESQSSSGVLVGTGTGSTGWCLSVWRQRRAEFPLPTPEARELSWFVREAWPSKTTGAELTEGLVAPDEALRVTASSDALVVFGDGVEQDRLELTWGQEATVSLSTRRLRLATA